MSDEEIIEEIKSLSPSENACIGILDLYNKEKEKNIPLIIDEKSINEYADELEDLLKIEDGTPIYFSIGERQAIKILSHYVRQSVPKSEIKENYISKDKIREKIKELEAIKEEHGNSLSYWGDWKDEDVYDEIIACFEELLEE